MGQENQPHSTKSTKDTISLPYANLNTIWGLERGSFVGILAGHQNLKLIDCLRTPEGLLQETLAEMESPLPLPKRSWLAMNVEQVLSKNPLSVENIVACASAQGQATEEIVFGSGTALGLVLEIAAAQCTRGNTKRLSDWSKPLLSGALRATLSPALVIHVNQGTNEETRDVVNGWNLEAPAPIIKLQEATQVYARVQQKVEAYLRDARSNVRPLELDKLINEFGLEDIVCALLRRAEQSQVGGPDNRLIRDWLDTLARDYRLSADLQALRTLFENNDDSWTWLCQSKGDLLAKLKLALKTQARLSFPVDQVSSLNLASDSVWWWLLRSLPPEKNLLKALLELDFKRRAVMGLCSPCEYEKLNTDGGLKDEVIQCRAYFGII